jgi:hypothetical protein
MHGSGGGQRFFEIRVNHRRPVMRTVARTERNPQRKPQVRLIMSTPTLRDLGLDDGDDSLPPVRTAPCEICGVAIPFGRRECDHCSEIRKSSSTTNRRVTSPTAQIPNATRTTGLPLKLIAGVIGVFVIVAMFRSKPETDRGQTTYSTNSPTPTYRDALQVLVDDIDQKLNANIFGDVTVTGKHAFVVVEASFFVKMAPDAQRLALEGIRDQWFSKCYGTNITFKTWNGTVVAYF